MWDKKNLFFYYRLKKYSLACTTGYVITSRKGLFDVNQVRFEKRVG